MRCFALTQSARWIEFLRADGKRVIEYEFEDGVRGYFVQHPLFAGRSYLRAIGFQIDQVSGASLQRFLEEKRTQGVVSVIFEGYGVKWTGEASSKMPFWSEIPTFLTKNVPPFKAKLAHSAYLPQFTTTLTLSLSEEELLANMKRKGRYNIKLAEEGVIVKKCSGAEVNDALLDTIYGLCEATAKRDGFKVHEKKHYEKLLKTLSDDVYVYMAYPKNAVVGDETTAEGKVESKVIAESKVKVKTDAHTLLACIIVCHTVKEAVYYYGASDHSFRSLMAPYALQWRAIRDAKKAGKEMYDFMGIAKIDPTTSAPYPDDSLIGVTDFKMKFGGNITMFEPAVEIVLSPVAHSILLCCKMLRTTLKKMLRFRRS